MKGLLLLLLIGGGIYFFTKGLKKNRKNHQDRMHFERHYDEDFDSQDFDNGLDNDDGSSESCDSFDSCSDDD